MAENDKAQRKAFIEALKPFGLAADFMALIDAAVRGDWGQQQFATRLIKTDAFQAKFPGLIEPDGTINSMLTGKAGAPVSLPALGQAVSAYKTAKDTYQDIATNYGYGKLSKDQFAMLFKQQDVSPDEFGTRLQATRTVNQNPDAMAAFERQARLAGIKLTKKDMFAFAAKTADKKFYDIYEAAQLQSQIGLKAKDAARLGKTLGQPGALDQRTLEQTIQYVRQNLAQVGPELQRQGIGAAKLVKIIGNPGSFSKEMDVIRQTVATREGLGRPVTGIYASKGTGGGLSLYEDQGDASYG